MSSLAVSFWFEPAEDAITMTAPVVTGTTGAWGKSENINSLSLATIGASTTDYKLTINYKVRWWW